jgi:hypothetical protein
MKSIKLLIGLGLLLTLKSCAQDQNVIVGEWVEVRREQRTGFVYNFLGGGPHEPSIEISFSDDGQGTFINTAIPVELEPKMIIEYKVLGDSLLVFGRLYELLKLQGDSLVLIRRNDSRFKSEDDFKFYFLRKEVYDRLSESEKKRLADPTEKDKAYLKTINEKREGN